MDKALQNLSAIFAFAAPPARSYAPLRRHWALAWILALASAVSVALLLTAILAASRSTRVFQDVNLSGSLRYRSLWVYGATQKNALSLPEDGGWPAQVAAMRETRRSLSKNYPAAVAATDPAWKGFTESLTQTGQVDWRTANTLRSAANTLTGQIEKDAAVQNAEAILLLRTGLGGLLGALTASCFLLSGLRAAEEDTRRVVLGLQQSQDLFLSSVNALQEGYLVQGRDGKTLFCNPAAASLLGAEAEALIGRELSGPECRCRRENGDEFPRTQQPGALALLDAQPQESVVLGLERSGSEVRWLSVNAAPVFRAGETAPCAAVLTFTDKTAERTIEDELQKEKEFQSAMLESLESGVVACDADGVLALFNRAARAFHGMDEAPLSAGEWASHFDLYQSDGISPLRTEDIPLARAFAGEVVRDSEMVIAPKDGPSRTVLASGQAIYSSGGSKIGAVVSMQDITARRRAEQELSRLAAIVESSEEAILATTLDGILVSWNAGAERLYGYAAGEVIGRHASILVPTGEAGPVPGIIPRILRGEVIPPVEVVRRRPDGVLLNMALVFSPIHSSSGKIIGLSCIARDVTARRQAEDALRESEARLRYLSDAAFEGIAVTQNGVVIDTNPAFLALYGYETPEQIAGLAGELLAAPEYRETVRQKIVDDFEEAYEAVCLRRDGSTFPAEVRGRKALWNGLPARVTAMRDMTERKRAEQQIQDYMAALELQKIQLEETNRELEALATTDGLSGLKNHRTFQAKLAEEYARAVRYHQPLSLLMLDVDHFKEFNDSFGHPAGDSVLQGVAEALQATARDTDVAARYGGEEFAVILPQTDEAGAVVIAERIRASVEGHPWDKRPITVSLGVCTLSLDTPAPASLIASADKALYLSKDAGRNRVTHGNPSAPPLTPKPPRASRAKRPVSAAS